MGLFSRKKPRDRQATQRRRRDIEYVDGTPTPTPVPPHMYGGLTVDEDRHRSDDSEDRSHYGSHDPGAFNPSHHSDSGPSHSHSDSSTSSSSDSGGGDDGGGGGGD